jgi:hypothetical protein
MWRCDLIQGYFSGESEFEYEPKQVLPSGVTLRDVEMFKKAQEKGNAVSKFN